MKERVQNWITTLCGFAVLVFGGFAVWSGKMPWYSLGAFLIIFYLFVRAKDPGWAKAILKSIVSGKVSSSETEKLPEEDKG